MHCIHGKSAVQRSIPKTRAQRMECLPYIFVGQKEVCVCLFVNPTTRSNTTTTAARTRNRCIANIFIYTSIPMHTYNPGYSKSSRQLHYLFFLLFLTMVSHTRTSETTQKMTFAPARNAPSLARRRVELSLMATVDKAEVCLSRADHLLFKAQFTAHHHICIFLQ